jgi:hypothetical protein
MSDSFPEAQRSAWSDREVHWRKRLRRLRLDAEPVEEQVTRLRRVTIALTVIATFIGLIFLSIFAAFGRLDVGGFVVVVLILPIAGFAWLDQTILEARASAYLRERSARFSRPTRPD